MPDLDYISLFDSASTDLDKDGGPVSLAVPPPPLAPALDGDANWQNDPVPVKLEKIRAAVLNARSAAEVTARAALIPIADWLDLVVKLSPKQIDVKSMQITAIRVELPPASDGADGDVIDVEMPG